MADDWWKGLSQPRPLHFAHHRPMASNYIGLSSLYFLLYTRSYFYTDRIHSFALYFYDTSPLGLHGAAFTHLVSQRPHPTPFSADRGISDRASPRERSRRVRPSPPTTLMHSSDAAGPVDVSLSELNCIYHATHIERADILLAPL